MENLERSQEACPQLPYEIWRQIFLYLPINSKIVSSVVCKLFYVFACEIFEKKAKLKYPLAISKLGNQSVNWRLLFLSQKFIHKKLNKPEMYISAEPNFAGTLCFPKRFCLDHYGYSSTCDNIPQDYHPTIQVVDETITTVGRGKKTGSISLKRWNTQTWKSETFVLPAQVIRQKMVKNFKDKIFAVSRDCFVLEFSTNPFKLVHILKHNLQGIPTCFEVQADKIFLGFSDGSVAVWHVNNNNPLVLPGNGVPVVDMHFNQDLFLVCEEKKVRVFRFDLDMKYAHFTTISSDLPICFARNNQDRVYTGHMNFLTCWCLNTGIHLKRISFRSKKQTSFNNVANLQIIDGRMFVACNRTLEKASVLGVLESESFTPLHKVYFEHEMTGLEIRGSQLVITFSNDYIHVYDLTKVSKQTWMSPLLKW